MSTTLQFRRYDTATISTLTGANGEIFIDSDKDTVVVQDGTTAGGFPLAREEAYTQANSARGQANTARDQANLALSRANTSYTEANAARDQANTARDTANAAYGQANAAYGQANAAYGQANNAYGAANLKLNLTGGTVSGDLTIQGNLFLSGNTTYINVATLKVDDSIIQLSSNSISDAVDIGFVGHYSEDGGTTNLHAGFIRHASDNVFYIFDGYAIEPTNNVIDIASANLATLRANVNALSLLLNGNTVATQANLTIANDQANTARDQANTARDTANGAYAQANGAYAHANIVYARANSSLDAYAQANSSRDQANTARDTANGAYAQANGAYNHANIIYADANSAYTQANLARDQANSAYNAANNAQVTVYANNASNVTTQKINFVNTASILVSVENDNGNANISFSTGAASVGDAYNQANAARDQANTAYGQANNGYAQANAAYADSNTRVLKAGDTMTGTLSVQSHISANVFRSTNTTLSAPSLSTFDGERLRLYDFQQAGHPNYAIGVEGSHIWHGVDDIGPTLGFKWYGNTTLVGLLRTNSTFEVSNTVSAKVLKASGTGTAVDASSGDILTNKVTGTEFAFLNGLYTTTVRANNSQIADYTFRLPSSGGTDGFVLSTDGTGNTLWSNSIYALANLVRDQANTARDQANTARGTANDAYGQANNAYAAANLKIDLSGGTFTGNINVAATLITQNIIPDANVTYSIGTSDKRFKDLWLSGSTIYLGDTVLSATGDEMRANTFNATVSFISAGLNVLDQANSARDQANTARITANDSYAQANSARDQANTSRDQANTARDQANTARDTANSAYGSANNSGADALNAYAQANTARGTANDAYGQANTARNQANTAYDTANLKLNLTGGTVTGDLTVSGNLFVTGANTLLNVSNLTVNDSIIFLANGQVGDAFDIGFVGHFDRSGTPTHAGLFRRATDNRFYLFDNYEVEPSNNIIDITGNNFRTGNLKLNTLNADSFVTTAGLNVTDQANTGRDQANTARDQANTARDTANSAYNAANNAQVTVYANSASDVTTQRINFVNTSTIQVSVTSTGSPTNANVTLTTVGDSSAATVQAAYNQANTARNTGNSAYGQANTATTNAGNAYDQANTARNTANSAYGAANNAVLKAGDTMTGIIVTAGVRNTKNTVDGTNANTNTNAANNINLDESNFFTRTLTASVAFTFRNAPASGNAHTFTLVVVQDGNGSRTPSFTNTVYWAGGTIPPATTTASARDVWQFVTFDGGTTYYGSLTIKNAS